MRWRHAILFSSSFVATTTLMASPGCAKFEAAPDPTLDASDATDATASDAATDVGFDVPLPLDGSSGALVLGPENMGSKNDDVAGGTAEAFRIVAARAGIARRVRLYLLSANTATRVHVGLYAEQSSSAGALLGTLTLSPTEGKEGWVDGVLTTPIPIQANTAYWVALLSPDPAARVHFRSTEGPGSGPAFDHVDHQLTALPPTWKNGQTDFGNAPIVMQWLE